MKQIVVDYKIPWLYPQAGIAGFFRPLLEAMVERHPELEFIVVAPGPFARLCPDRPNCKAMFLGDFSALSRFEYLRYSLITFPAFVAQSGADLLLCPYYDFLPPENFRGKTLLTVHDLCFLDIPAQYPFWTRWLHRWLLNYNLPRAGGVITVSDFSRSRLMAHFPALLSGREPQVVYNTFAPRRETADEAGLKALTGKLGLPPGERVVLYTGGIDARKNLTGLFSGFAELLRSTAALLLITGGISDASALRNLVRRFGLEGRVIFTGPLEADEMRLLYRRIADCGISVSLYEGFGRGAIESKLHALPFVSSSLPVVREMVGEYPLYCDQQSPADIGAKLRQALAAPRGAAETDIDERFSLLRNANLLSDLIDRTLSDDRK